MSILEQIDQLRNEIDKHRLFTGKGNNPYNRQSHQAKIDALQKQLDQLWATIGE